MTNNVCEAAWDSLRKIPYNKESVDEFESVCNEMFDFPISLKFKNWKDGKMMVEFEYSLASGKEVGEFYDMIKNIMSDTLCYNDEAKRFIELMD